MDAIKEVMALVEAHRQKVIAVMDGEGSLIDVQSAEQAIESKLRDLLEQKAARIAELEKDARRIDWLEGCEGVHGFYHEGYGEYKYYTHLIPGFETVRETIDAAMKGDQ